METQVVHADKIKCGGCAAAIQEALGKLPGVSSVEVDVPTGKVTVSGEGLDLQRIRQDLQEAGYPPRD